MRARITTRRLHTHTVTAVRYIWDTELRGFGVRISPSGSVSWLVQRWYGGRGGRPFRYVLGNYPSMSLVDARRQAQIDIGEMCKGTNLVLCRKGQRTQIKKDVHHTLAVVAEHYVSSQSTGSEYWHQTHNRFNKLILPTLGSYLPVTAITKSSLRSLDLTDHNTYSSLSAFFTYCLTHDYLETNPLATIPAPKPPKARERYLTTSEIKAYWSATETLSYPWKHFYQLVLLTAQRRDEVASLEWSEMDGETWTIPASKTKNGKEHLVHLSGLSVCVLAQVPKSASSFVFTTNGKTPISGFSKAKKLLPVFDTPYVIHDLRRTFATHAASLGVLPDVADRVLNHVSGTRSGVKGVYQKFEFIKERKEALEMWSRYLRELAQGML